MDSKFSILLVRSDIEYQTLHGTLILLLVHTCNRAVITPRAHARSGVKQSAQVCQCVCHQTKGLNTSLHHSNSGNSDKT